MPPDLVTPFRNVPGISLSRGDRMRQDTTRSIRHCGQHIWVISADPDDHDSWPFLYTVGNHGHGMPELLLIAGDGEGFVDVLNRLGRLQRERGTGLRAGEVVAFDACHGVRLVDAGAIGRDDYAVQVGVYYRTEAFRVLQVILSDEAGRFPEDPACDPDYREQPLVARPLS